MLVRKRLDENFASAESTPFMLLYPMLTGVRLLVMGNFQAMLHIWFISLSYGFSWADA